MLYVSNLWRWLYLHGKTPAVAGKLSHRAQNIPDRRVNDVGHEPRPGEEPQEWEHQRQKMVRLRAINTKRANERNRIQLEESTFLYDVMVVSAEAYPDLLSKIGRQCDLAVRYPSLAQMAGHMDGRLAVRIQGGPSQNTAFVSGPNSRRLK